MSFDWAEYLNLAGELCATPTSPSTDEAKYRSAISRAYYAAFGKAKNHLRNNDGDTAIPTGASAHKYVRRKFEFSTSRPVGGLDRALTNCASIET